MTKAGSQGPNPEHFHFSTTIDVPTGDTEIVLFVDGQARGNSQLPD